jgi:hypothetical protein
MGADCRAYIKPIAKVEDILQVAAILLGSEKVVRETHHDGQQYDVVNLGKDSLKVRPSVSGSVDKQGYITNYDNFLSVVVKSNIPNQEFANMFFLQPNTNSSGATYFSARSNAKICALGLKMIEIFGGKLSPNDQESTEGIVTVKKGTWNKLWTDNEDEGFVAKHKFFKELQPLNEAYLTKGRAIAAYSMDDVEFKELVEHFQTQANPVEVTEVETNAVKKPKRKM